jgi:hypothetical protein
VTDYSGSVSIELIEYSVNGNDLMCNTPYKVKIRDVSQDISLNQNTELTVVVQEKSHKRGRTGK